MDHFVTRLSWEWFQASGEKTMDRLQDIVLHQADVHCLSDGLLEQVLIEARQKFIARYGWENA